MKTLNPYILLVIKWLNNEDSVTEKELVADAYAADAYAAADAAYAAAEKHINRYFELTGENKQDYIDDEPVTVPTFTQAMADEGVLPSVGMECLILNRCDAHPNYKNATIKYIGDLVIYAYVESGERCDSKINLKFKPLTPPKTDTEKAIDDLEDAYTDYTGNIESFHKIIFKAIKAGKIHGITFTGKS